MVLVSLAFRHLYVQQTELADWLSGMRTNKKHQQCDVKRTFKLDFSISPIFIVLTD